MQSARSACVTEASTAPAVETGEETLRARPALCAGWAAEQPPEQSVRDTGRLRTGDGEQQEPRWLASREACRQRPSPLGGGRLSRNDALPSGDVLTGRHGTSCRGDGSGLLLECRKAREPLRSKRWLASAAASENTWTRDPGAHRADASPLSGVDGDLVYAPTPCGWVETVYDAPTV